MTKIKNGQGPQIYRFLTIYFGYQKVYFFLPQRVAPRMVFYPHKGMKESFRLFVMLASLQRRMELTAMEKRKMKSCVWKSEEYI